MNNTRKIVKTRLMLAIMACLVPCLSVAGGPKEPKITQKVVADSAKTTAQRLTDLKDKANRQGSVRIIVQLKTPATAEATLQRTQVDEQRRNLTATQDKVLGKLRENGQIKEDSIKRFSITPGFAISATADNITKLLENPDVESVVEDGKNFPALYESSPLIGATDAWASGYAGSGQVVAILDTGVFKSHPFLTGKVVSEACYSTNDSGSWGSSTSLCPGGASSSVASGSGLNCNTATWGEGCSHGTHVAGISAGKNGNSSGGTMSGVAKEANLIAIQVFSGATVPGEPPDVWAYDSDLIKGLERVYSLRTTYNIAAANMSLGGDQFFSTCDTSPLKPIIDNLRAVGIATVIASGNNGWDGATGSPGCVSTAITVGSSTKTNQKASYSNMASWVDLFGPGSAICSSIVGVTSGCGTGYASWNGTSMAAPQVTGAWAVMKSKKPTATVSEIEQALESTGVPISTYLGNWPRISLIPALAALGGATSGNLFGLSARALVNTGDNILIGGFQIKNGSKRVIIRGIGQSMGIPGVLSDPELTLYNGQTVIGYNDNWSQATNAALIQSIGWAPSFANESAILIDLPVGEYTFQLRGRSGGTGIGLVQVYDTN